MLRPANNASQDISLTIIPVSSMMCRNAHYNPRLEYVIAVTLTLCLVIPLKLDVSTRQPLRLIAKLLIRKLETAKYVDLEIISRLMEPVLAPISFLDVLLMTQRLLVLNVKVNYSLVRIRPNVLKMLISC